LTSGTTIKAKETEKPGVEKPIFIGYPLLHQSGMTFVTGDKYYPNWKFIGGVFKNFNI
jgi:hypothetical protein